MFILVRKKSKNVLFQNTENGHIQVITILTVYNVL